MLKTFSELWRAESRLLISCENSWPAQASLASRIAPYVEADCL